MVLLLHVNNRHVFSVADPKLADKGRGRVRRTKSVLLFTSRDIYRAGREGKGQGEYFVH